MMRDVDSKYGRVAGSVNRAAAVAAAAGSSLWRLRDPAERLRRRRRRARWGVAMRAVPTAALGVLAGDAIAAGETVGGASVAVVAAAGVVATGAAARRAWRVYQLPMPAPAPVIPLRRSAARPALQRLAAQERALDELLPLLGPSALDTRAEADAAASALRDYSRRLAAVEAARPAGSRGDRRSLDAATQALTARLDDGVRAHGRLVAAAAEAVAASSGAPDAFALQRLGEEADRLSALASGLRELSPGSLGTGSLGTGSVGTGS